MSGEYYLCLESSVVLTVLVRPQLGVNKQI